jgi:hypothetical protein
MVQNIEGEMEGTHIESDGFNLHFQAHKQLHRRKVIIDTDPGIGIFQIISSFCLFIQYALLYCSRVYKDLCLQFSYES